MNRSPWFLLRFLTSHLWTAFVSVLLSAAAVLLGIGLIGTSSYLISFAALQPSISVLQVAIVGVRFFGISKSVFRYMERLVSHAVNFRMLENIRVWFYHNLVPLIPWRGTQRSTGDLLSNAVDDVETLEFFFIRVINPPLAAIFTGLISAVIFRGFQARLLITFLICFFTSFVIALLFSIWMSGLTSRYLLQKRSNIQTAVIDYIEGLPDLLINQSQGMYAKKVDQVAQIYGRAELLASTGFGVINGLVVVLTNLSMYFMFIQGVQVVTSNDLNGIFLAGTALITLASFEAIQPMMLAAQQFTLSSQAGQRMLNVLGDQISSEVQKSQTILLSDAVSIGQVNNRRYEKPNLEVVDISFRYESQQKFALQNISFDLNYGQKIAVVGASGAGKSTLAKILMGFWRPESGTIHIDHKNMDAISDEDLRSIFAYSTPDAYFFNDTLESNLRLAKPDADDKQMLEVIEAAQLLPWYLSLKDGFGTVIGEKGYKISTGERRRLDIARMLLRDAPIMILDEPFSGLDSLTEQSLFDSILKIRKGKSLILITHRLTELSKMDSIHVLDQGKIVERNTHTGLIAHSGLYSKMWHLQQKILLDNVS